MIHNRGLGHRIPAFEFVLFSGLCILIPLTAINCSPTSQEPPEGYSVENISTNDLLAKIQTIDSLFELNDIIEQFNLRADKPAQEALAALYARRDQLINNADVIPAIPGALDFYGWDIQWVGVDPDRQRGDDRENYKISGYFVVNGKMDRDWVFKIMTKVDESHVHLLPANRRDAGYINWSIRAPTSTWEPGEHHILSTTAKLKPIPYYISARMFYPPELKNHASFSYGWFADPDVGSTPNHEP